MTHEGLHNIITHIEAAAEREITAKRNKAKAAAQPKKRRTVRLRRFSQTERGALPLNDRESLLRPKSV